MLKNCPNHNGEDRRTIVDEIIWVPKFIRKIRLIPWIYARFYFTHPEELFRGFFGGKFLGIYIEIKSYEGT